MIPVAPKPEPSNFDSAVRKPGAKWLKKKQLSLVSPLPPKTKVPPHWRKCLDDLHTAYDGVCAYLCIFVERVTGGVSADHFVAKSQLAGQTYEWANYRLACTTMNARKRDYTTVLDPFQVTLGSFRLELITGRIFANPSLVTAAKAAVDETIRVLGLDDATCREMRVRRFDDYIAARGSTRNAALEAQLKKYSPLLWHEAARQGVL